MQEKFVYNAEIFAHFTTTSTQEKIILNPKKNSCYARI